ncbi:glycosyltransferase family 2 protein [Brachyspira intermedia]|uniref:glycosyltransferase family 2 protein n=1 Tax=Brachyspira intermedia TaxID=84377 RepID=UPI0030054B6A
MDEKIRRDIDNIVWWIPLKKFRNSLRNYLLEINNNINNLNNKIQNITENQINYIEKLGYIDTKTINIENQINYIYKDLKIKLNYISSMEYNYDRNILNNIKPPYISIIVPIYDIGKEYLVNCLDSLVNQTLKEIEIILVNDCSPNEEDNLICEEYASKDNRIKYIKHIENKGPGGARMTALREANGYAIAFADPDDTVALNAYEIAISRMLINNVDIVSFNFYWIENNEITDMHINIPQFLYGNNILYSLSTEKIHGPLWDKIYKKELIDKFEFDLFIENNKLDDMIAIVKILSIANSYEYITVPLYFHNRRSSSITNDIDKKYIFDDRKYLIKNVFEYFNINPLLKSKKNEMNNYFVYIYKLCYAFIDMVFYKTKQTEEDYKTYISQRGLLKQLIVDNIKDGYITEEIFLDICNKRNLWYIRDLYYN